MKDLKIEHLVSNGFDKEQNVYKFTAYFEKNVYQFLVEEVQKGVSGRTYPMRGCSDEYIIKLGGHIILQSVLVTLCSPSPQKAICDYLNYDYDKFKNDIYASIDKKYFFDYVKDGMSDYDVILPVNNILTPNTNWSDSDTVLAVLDKEHSLLDNGEDYDFLISIFHRLLSYDKSYVKPFLVALSEHLFSEFLTSDEQLELKKSGRFFLHKPDKFSRSFQSYSDHIDFKYSYKSDDECDDENSVEKFVFTIRRDAYNQSSQDLSTDLSSSFLKGFFPSILGFTHEARKAFLDKQHKK